jgi:hypothetical protein
MDWLQLLTLCAAIVLGSVLAAVTLVLLAKFFIARFILKTKKKAVHFVATRGSYLAQVASQKAIGYIQAQKDAAKQKTVSYLKDKTQTAIRSSIDFVAQEAKGQVQEKIAASHPHKIIDLN